MEVINLHAMFIHDFCRNLVAINPQDRYHRTLRAMTYYGLGRFDETLDDITILIGSNRNDPSNAPLIEIERRLLNPHHNSQP